jgi:hypothetical protein
MGKKAAIQGALRTSEAPDTASFIGQKTLSLSELAASLPVPDTPRLVQRIRSGHGKEHFTPPNLRTPDGGNIASTILTRATAPWRCIT